MALLGETGVAVAAVQKGVHALGKGRIGVVAIGADRLLGRERHPAEEKEAEGELHGDHFAAREPGL